MAPTVADVLALPEMQAGRPRVAAGAAGLDRPVRWVHVSELADIAALLHGGELVLTTGIALPDGAGALAAYVGELAAAGAVGLVVELGRRYAELPPALVSAAEAHALPLVALRREVAYVEVTQAVHSLIVHAQVALLERSARVHEAFTAMSLEGAAPEEIVRVAADLAGASVVVESAAHRVLHSEPRGVRRSDLLRDWEHRSRRAETAERTAVAGPEDWVVTRVGARGEAWGRLVVVPAGEPEPLHAVVAERAATALAVNRLAERDREALELQTHRTLLVQLLDGAWSSVRDVEARAAALGVPLAARTLVPVVLRALDVADGPPLAAEARRRALLDAVAAALPRVGLRALVAPVEHDVGVLLALEPPRPRPDAVAAFAAAVHAGSESRTGIRIGVGPGVRELREVPRAFAEARQVTEAATALQDDRLFHELPDVGLRGLLHLLRDDVRLQTFVERELGALLSYDEQHRAGLRQALQALLDAGGNKSLAAARAAVSRPALYHRLRTIERVLGVDLDSPEVRLSLHVALLGYDATAGRVSAPSAPRAAPARRRRPASAR